MERSTRDKIRTQAMDSGLSQSETFQPLSPDRSDVAHEHDIMLPIKREVRVDAQGTLFRPLAVGTWSLLWRPVFSS